MQCTSLQCSHCDDISRYLSVNSPAPELTARVRLGGRVKLRNRVRLSASINVNNNYSGAGELTNKDHNCFLTSLSIMGWY